MLVFTDAGEVILNIRNGQLFTSKGGMVDRLHIVSSCATVNMGSYFQKLTKMQHREFTIHPFTHKRITNWVTDAELNGFQAIAVHLSRFLKIDENGVKNLLEPLLLQKVQRIYLLTLYNYYGLANNQTVDVKPYLGENKWMTLGTIDNDANCLADDWVMCNRILKEALKSNLRIRSRSLFTVRVLNE